MWLGGRHGCRIALLPATMRSMNAAEVALPAVAASSGGRVGNGWQGTRRLLACCDRAPRCLLLQWCLSFQCLQLLLLHGIQLRAVVDDSGCFASSWCVLQSAPAVARLQSAPVVARHLSAPAVARLLSAPAVARLQSASVVARLLLAPAVARRSTCCCRSACCGTQPQQRSSTARSSAIQNAGLLTCGRLGTSAPRSAQGRCTRSRPSTAAACNCSSGVSVCGHLGSLGAAVDI